MRSALIELLASPGPEVVSDAGIWHAPRNILWYSPHHPLRREQTADRSIEVVGNSTYRHQD
jgi:hypothetical protein